MKGATSQSSYHINLLCATTACLCSLHFPFPTNLQNIPYRKKYSFQMDMHRSNALCPCVHEGGAESVTVCGMTTHVKWRTILKTICLLVQDCSPSTYKDKPSWLHNLWLGSGFHVACSEHRQKSSSLQTCS